MTGKRRKQLISKYFRSEEHTSELQSLTNLVCRLLLEKKQFAGRTRPHGGLPQRVEAGTRARRGTPGDRGATAPGAGQLLSLFFLNDRAPPGIHPLPLPAALLL